MGRLYLIAMHWTLRAVDAQTETILGRKRKHPPAERVSCEERRLEYALESVDEKANGIDQRDETPVILCAIFEVNIYLKSDKDSTAVVEWVVIEEGDSLLNGVKESFATMKGQDLHGINRAFFYLFHACILRSMLAGKVPELAMHMDRKSRTQSLFSSGIGFDTWSHALDLATLGTDEPRSNRRRDSFAKSASRNTI